MTTIPASEMAIAQAKLQEIWGYSHFRPPQDTIIQALLEQRDALIILPTGGGKSLCFQLPALLQSGLTLVLSPLVALMENQVEELRDRHLPAASLHSELSKRERHRALKTIEQQQLRLLYLSPETLFSRPVWTQLTRPDLKLNGLVLDEAHCLTQWGETFRPAYRRLGVARQTLQAVRADAKIPIAAFTATADPTAQSVIRQTLGLRSPQVFRLSPYRANLDLTVQTVWTPRGRQQALLRFIQKHSGETGLVYVRTRRDSEGLAEWLRQRGYQAANYHAGLAASDRRQREAAWINNHIQIVVATNAFGMGVNKPDLRWVAHYHVPCLLTEYVQEIGRAGRDGKPAQALSLISEQTGWLDPTDRQRSRFFASQAQKVRQQAIQISQQIPTEGSLEQVKEHFKIGAIALSYLHSQGQLEWIDPFHYRLHLNGADHFSKTTTAKAALEDTSMTRFLQSRNCRWQTIVNQFGFRKEAHQLNRCGHCDNCRQNRHG